MSRTFPILMVHNSRGNKHDGMPMMLMRWLKNKLHRTPRPDSAEANQHADLTVQLVVKSREVSDEEMARIRQQRKQSAKEWAALGNDEQRRRQIEAFHANAQHNRERAMQSGVTHYVGLAWGS